MKKNFSLSFQHKIILALMLFINVPLLLIGYMAKDLTHRLVIQEKENKLFALAHILDSQLDPGGFEAILRAHGAEDASREEKISILNQALRPITDKIGNSALGLGVGYYSRDLDAIITYGPSSKFGQAVGLSIPESHPGRMVMNSNASLLRSGSMVRGNIMNAMIPIVRGGEVIGYIWANELITDITAQLDAMTRNILAIVLLCFVVAAVLLYILSRRTLRDVGRIISGVRAMRSDLSCRIEDSGGDLGEVVRNINALTEEIDKANQERERAISVLQSVMSNMEATIYVCDPKSGTLVYVNDYLSDILGRHDLQGKPCTEIARGFGEKFPDCAHKKLFDYNDTPILTPIRSEVHFSSLNRDFLITDRLVTWHDGKLLHMQVGTDVTERNALAIAEAANQAQRDFLARMSHEIRTPMNGVLGMTRLAIQADPPPKQLEYLKKIQSSASLLLGVINDILDFSRIEAGKISLEKHRFNLWNMIENIRELILPRTQENGLELTVSINDNVPEFAVGDELRLSQVLLNLLGNASKFTLNGSVTLEAHIENLSSGTMRLHCSVKDSGIGMTPEQQKILFDPFAQADTSTSREFGGTGLGLPITKALVELMGGKILVTSEAGKGSTFSFFVELTVCDPTALQEDEHEELWENARYDGKTFLLVEDNAINREIAFSILTDLGAKVETANNGKEGVDAFMKKDFDLIFMDVRMPIMDGLEASRQIRASGKHDARTIPIIAMTANVMKEDREASEKAGMNGHLAKPIDIKELAFILFKNFPPSGTTGEK